MGPAIAWLAAGLLAGASAGAERVTVPEGWYQVEDGYGETDDSEVSIVVLPDEAEAEDEEPDGRQAVPSAAVEAPPLSEEVARFRQPDCELARGRYLERLLELHGVYGFVLDPRALAAWTHTRPPPDVAAYGFNGTLGDPAMAPLYGEPPVPPGPLSFDLELQTLARELLVCQGAAP